jgi:hypothetical protein|tara:strand:+ start:6352 stop:6759 length:408 start_codon:yes stop_codon:yes gene_type:complete
MKPISILFTSFLIFFSCEEERFEGEPYQYIAYYEKSLRVCAEGTMEFDIGEDSTIIGTWEIEAVEEFSINNIGPQTGTGDLSGNIKNGQFFVNLNPNWADNNVFLNGYYGEEIRGGWSWSTLVGPRSSGGFVIKK